MLSFPEQSSGKRAPGELSPLTAVAIAIAIHALFFFGMSHGAVQRATVVVSRATGSSSVPVSLVASAPAIPGIEPNAVSIEIPKEAPPEPNHVKKPDAPKIETAPEIAKPKSTEPKINRSKSKPVVERKLVNNQPQSTVGRDSVSHDSEGAAASADPQASGAALDRSRNGFATSVTRGAPDYLVNPPPQYPSASRRLKEEGVVLLTVKISAEGSVTNVTIHQSSGFERLDDAALNAVQGWRFKPSKVDGIAIADTVEVPVRFTLR